MEDKLSLAITGSSTSLDHFDDLRKMEANTDKDSATWGNEVKRFMVFANYHDANKWLWENRKIDIIDCHIDFSTRRTWILYSGLPQDITDYVEGVREID